MGLFDFLKKPKELTPEEQAQQEWSNTVTMEQYLQAAKSENILEVVHNVIKIDYDYDRSTCVPILEGGWYGEHLYWHLDLPSATCLIGQKANAEELLKVIETRGDCPNAAFYLGVFYEIGLFPAENNLEEAQRHYNIAVIQGSKLETMLEALRPVMIRKQNLIIDEKEALGVSINPLNIKMMHGELYKLLTAEDIKQLLFVYTVALGHLTNLGYPCATSFLASALYNWGEEEPPISDIFVKGIGKYHNIGDWILDRLIESARGGNGYAVAALRNIGVSF